MEKDSLEQGLRQREQELRTLQEQNDTLEKELFDLYMISKWFIQEVDNHTENSKAWIKEICGSP